MANATSTSLAAELLRCEHEYLEAVQSGDGDAAARLTAPESLVVSGHGAMKVDAAAVKKMVAEHDASRRYHPDDAGAQVIELGDNVAIIAYRLETTMPDGRTTAAYDTDVWVRDGGQWKCALHAEIPAEGK